MRPCRISRTLPALVLISAIPVSGFAQDMIPDKQDVSVPKKEYSPYADDHFPTGVFFGDTHLHTSWSTWRTMRKISDWPIL